MCFGAVAGSVRKIPGATRQRLWLLQVSCENLAIHSSLSDPGARRTYSLQAWRSQTLAAGEGGGFPGPGCWLAQAKQRAKICQQGKLEGLRSVPKTAHWSRSHGEASISPGGCLVEIGLSPFPVTVTTRIIPFLAGNPYKLSFALPLLLGRGTTQGKNCSAFGHQIESSYWHLESIGRLRALHSRMMNNDMNYMSNLNQCTAISCHFRGRVLQQT